MSNYAGNAFAKDAWKMIQESNPLTKPQKVNTALLDMFAGLNVGSKQEAKEMNDLFED